MLIYQEFLALNDTNEMAAFDPSERLRFAVHEIMIRLKDAETIKFEEMSKILKKEFKINITPEILKEIFDKWDKNTNPDYSVFKKEDKNWMDVWAFQGYVKRKCRDKQSFGKHRNKTTYSTGSSYRDYDYGYGYGVGYGGYSGRGGGQWVGGVWVPNNKKSTTATDDDNRFNNPLELWGD